MRTIRGVFLAVLIATVGAIFAIVPQVARAVPPGGVRAWLFMQHTIGARNILVVFHDPADLSSGPGGQSRFEQLTYNQPLASAGIHAYSDTNPVYSGQSVAVTAVLWFDESRADLLPVVGAQHMDQAIPYLASDSTQVWSSRLTSEKHFPLTFTGPTETPNYYVLSGSTVNGRSGRPNVIESVVYTAPETTVPSGVTYATHAIYYLSQNGGPVSFFTSSPEALLKVMPRQQKVEVKGGPVAVDQLNSSAHRLIPADARGETVVTASNVTSCAWVAADIQGDCTTNPPVTIGLYTRAASTRSAAWSTLTRTMSKLAQERGEFTNATGSALSTTIKSFIERSADIWKASRGEILFVTATGDLSIDPGTTMTLVGKKIVVFTGASSVTWRSNIVESVANSPNQKFATILFTNGGTMELDGDAYAGAYISKGTVRLAGSGTTMNIFGLVVSDAFSVTRAVDPATSTVIARISYDPSFQNGTVVGLSPFIYPLVSGGADR